MLRYTRSKIDGITVTVEKILVYKTFDRKNGTSLWTTHLQLPKKAVTDREKGLCFHSIIKQIGTTTLNEPLLSVSIAFPLGQKCIFFILLVFNDNRLLLKYCYIYSYSVHES